jgi:hypothetical protein
VDPEFETVKAVVRSRRKRAMSGTKRKDIWGGIQDEGWSSPSNTAFLSLRKFYVARYF